MSSNLFRRIAVVTALCCIFSYIMTLRSSFMANAAAVEPMEGKAECVMELNSRRVLYQSRGDIRLPMASTTKILTAATVLNLCKNIDVEFEIPIQAVGVEGSSVYLKQGDVYSVKDLLYGLMLRSGNDCATALAYYCSGGIQKFTTEMNKLAQKAGALDSRFQNPHGLPCKEHYTTAKDLTSIACYAMQNPIFQEIVSTKYYTPRHWKNKNKMLTEYEGGIGVKTGYTKEAGRCLVSAAKREDMTLVCTVLNCSMTYERSAKLLDDAFASYKLTKLLDRLHTFEIEYNGKTIKCNAKEDYYYPLLKEEAELVKIITLPTKNTNKNVKNGEIVGQFKIYLANQLLFLGNLYKL